MQKFWEHLSYRMIIIHHENLGQIDKMKKEKIKNLCKMCDHRIYKDGEQIDISTGGIMLRGGIKAIGAQHNGEDFDIVHEMNTNRDSKDTKFQTMGMSKTDSALSESKKFKNLSHIMATKVLR